MRQVPGAQQMNAPISNSPSISARVVNGYQLESHTVVRQNELRPSAQRSAQALSIEFSPWMNHFAGRHTFTEGLASPILWSILWLPAWEAVKYTP